jgi:hypothetical protein
MRRTSSTTSTKRCADARWRQVDDTNLSGTDMTQRRSTPGRALAMTLATATVTTAWADSAPVADPATGLLSWRLREDALSVELNQLLPDQTRAFFQGRGFPAASADELARACVLQVIVSNTGDGVEAPFVAIDLRRWRIDAGQGPVPLPVEATWQPRWASAGVSPPARVAFRWALLPTEQTFGPGDHAWGMLPLGPAPGTTVDLTVVWDENGRERVTRVPAVQCSPDRTVGPVAEGLR